MKRMQAEQRASSYNAASKDARREGTSYTAELALSNEWCVVTWRGGKEVWREYE